MVDAEVPVSVLSLKVIAHAMQPSMLSNTIGVASMSEESNWKVVVPAKRGLAAMTPERRKEIASKGGKSVPANKRAFSVNKDLAIKAGRKGGAQARPEKRAFSMDPALASRAGKLGAPKKGHH
jgi:general stress protein YciG